MLLKKPLIDMNLLRPLQNASFCPISTSDSNINPRNTQCKSTCPVGPADRTGVVKMLAFFELEPRLNIKYGFNWAGKNEHFSKVSMCIVHYNQFFSIFQLSLRVNFDYFRIK